MPISLFQYNTKWRKGKGFEEEIFQNIKSTRELLLYKKLSPYPQTYPHCKNLGG